MLGILKIVFHLFGEDRFDINLVRVLVGGEQLLLVLVHNRRERSDSRGHEQGRVVLILVHIDILRNLGTGAYDCHAAGKHVENLRQLVEAELAELPAYAGNARIAVGGDHRAEALGVDDHCAELEYLKVPTVLCHSFLPEHYRTL